MFFGNRDRDRDCRSVPEAGPPINGEETSKDGVNAGIWRYLGGGQGSGRVAACACSPKVLCSAVQWPKQAYLALSDCRSGSHHRIQTAFAAATVVYTSDNLTSSLGPPDVGRASMRRGADRGRASSPPIPSVSPLSASVSASPATSAAGPGPRIDRSPCPIE